MNRSNQSNKTYSERGLAKSVYAQNLCRRRINVNKAESNVVRIGRTAKPNGEASSGSLGNAMIVGLQIRDLLLNITKGGRLASDILLDRSNRLRSVPL